MTEQTLRSIHDEHVAGTLKPNELDASGLSKLHRAAFTGQLLSVKCLASYGADILLKSKEGLVAAHYAAAGGHLPILQYLYDRDEKSVELQNDAGLHPLYIAAQEGQLDCLIWLNKYTTCIKTIVGGQKMNSALISAQEGRLDCLRYLLRVDRTLATSVDNNGYTVLHYAAIEGQTRVIKWLIDHCNINGEVQSFSGQTALHLAAIGGHASVIELLSRIGASLTIIDTYGKTALEYATHSKDCYELLQKKMAIIFDGSDDGSDKKVRFDEIIQTYDTFPNHHHASLIENKNARRKERSGIFWDADLQAEFDSWRNSPKMSKSRKKIQIVNPSRLYKGQSLVLRQFLVKTPTQSTLPWSASSSFEALSERPDILKNLNETSSLKGGSLSSNNLTQSPSDTTPPPVPERSSVRNKMKHKRPKIKITEENIQNSLKRYHSIDIGQALHELEEHDQKKNEDMNLYETIPLNINISKDDHVGFGLDAKQTSSPITVEPPPPPIRKNSPSSFGKIPQNDNVPEPSSNKNIDHNENIKQAIDKSQIKVITNEINYVAPMLRPRYRSMMKDDEIPIGYRPTSYLAQSGSFRTSLDSRKSLSTADLTDSSLHPSFTNYLEDSSHRSGISKSEDLNMDMKKTIFTQKKKKLPSFIRGFTSLIKNKKQDPYENLFETPTAADTLGRKKQEQPKIRKSLFVNFTLPRSRKKDLDALFDSSPKSGIYTPYIAYDGHFSRKESKLNTPSIAFSSKRIDQSLKGTNEYIKEIEKQQNILRSPHISETMEKDKSPVAIGRIKDNANSRQERVNAFIW